ncbi:unnamed protein product [Owenia fusiformis]|uniref:Uncharacterized protein n=1 Tax=Owenia fusiformis TaxID=6347 RepID=A0A8J1UDG3_OWEFU|nr:unnamed protein product [Owenia fusiformis]
MGNEGVSHLKHSKFERFRHKLAHILHSHPALIIVCFLAISDMCFVVGQLICDLLIIRNRLDRTVRDTNGLTQALNRTYPGDYYCYDGRNLQDLLRFVRSNGTDVRPRRSRRSLDEAEERNPIYLSQVLIAALDNLENVESYGALFDFCKRHYLEAFNPEQMSKQHNHEHKTSDRLILTKRNAAKYLDPDSSKQDLFTEDFGQNDPTDFNSNMADCNKNVTHRHPVPHGFLYRLTHYLHYGSLAALSAMVLEKILRLFSFGKHFFHSKLEVFDAFVVFVSWILDIILIRGIWHYSMAHSALLLVILLPWRVIRIVNCFIIVFKEKYKIEIRILTTARKSAEKNTASMARQTIRYKTEINALRGVCRKNGVDETTIGNCHVNATEHVRRRRSLTTGTLLASTQMLLGTAIAQDPMTVQDVLEQNYHSDEEKNGPTGIQNGNARQRSASIDSWTLGQYANLDRTVSFSQAPDAELNADYKRGRRDSFDGIVFWVDPEKVPPIGQSGGRVNRGCPDDVKGHSATITPNTKQDPTHF